MVVIVAYLNKLINNPYIFQMIPFFWLHVGNFTIYVFINENIFYLGQSYAFFWQNINSDLLFNGNNKSNNSNFDLYLRRLGYSFKNDNNEIGYKVMMNLAKILSRKVLETNQNVLKLTTAFSLVLER